MRPYSQSIGTKEKLKNIEIKQEQPEKIVVDFKRNEIANVYSLTDNRTAIETTISVNRETFDKIAHATTYGDLRWDELGVDDDKRWIVVNGQRFEVEHSPEEKAIRKQAQRNILLDSLTKNKKESPESKYYRAKKQIENIELLKHNPPVFSLLKGILGVGLDQGVSEYFLTTNVL